VATGAFVDVFVPSGSGGLNVPVGLDFGPDQNLYVVSNAQSAVLRYDGDTGAFIDAFVPSGSGLNEPTGLIFGPDDDLYVSSRGSDKVLRFDGASGTPLGDFVTMGSGGLDAPRGLAFGPDGHLYGAEVVNDSVRRFDGVTGAFIDVFVTGGSGGLDRANDVEFGFDGRMYVPSFNNDRVLVYDSANGAFLYELPDTFIDGPAWVAVDCAAPTVGIPSIPAPIARLAIEPNVPNPFDARTRIAFTLPESGPTRVTVLDLAGRVVATLFEGTLTAGRHVVGWDAGRDAAPAGIYFLRVSSGADVRAIKMMRLD
jgi:DNA-binding beta-propeller fold protein YncE